MKKTHQHQQSKIPVVGSFKADYIYPKTMWSMKRLVRVSPKPQSTHANNVIDCHILFLFGNKDTIFGPEMVIWLAYDKWYMSRSFSDFLHALFHEHSCGCEEECNTHSCKPGKLCLRLDSYRWDDWLLKSQERVKLITRMHTAVLD